MSGSLDLSTSQREGLASHTDHGRDAEGADNAEGGDLHVADYDAEDSGSETNDLSSILAYLIRR